MAKRKISDTVRSLNTKYGRYGRRFPYQRVFMAIVDGRVPAERDASGRFWLIDEDDEPLIARTLGLIPTEPDAESSKPPQNPSLPPATDTPAKPELAAKASKPARPRTDKRRSAA
jgi:hypothetical protein